MSYIYTAKNPHCSVLWVYKNLNSRSKCLGQTASAARESGNLNFGNMAEWLRRQTRNLVGSALVGSNPAVVESPFIPTPNFSPSILYISHIKVLSICDLSRYARCEAFGTQTRESVAHA